MKILSKEWQEEYSQLVVEFRAFGRTWLVCYQRGNLNEENVMDIQPGAGDDSADFKEMLYWLHENCAITELHNEMKAYAQKMLDAGELK